MFPRHLIPFNAFLLIREKIKTSKKIKKCFLGNFGISWNLCFAFRFRHLLTSILIFDIHSTTNPVHFSRWHRAETCQLDHVEPAVNCQTGFRRRPCRAEKQINKPIQKCVHADVFNLKSPLHHYFSMFCVFLTNQHFSTFWKTYTAVENKGLLEHEGWYSHKMKLQYTIFKVNRTKPVTMIGKIIKNTNAMMKAGAWSGQLTAVQYYSPSRETSALRVILEQRQRAVNRQPGSLANAS